MNETYYYFDDKNFDILLSSDSLNLTPYTFNNGNIYEMESIHNFYNLIKDSGKNCNIIDIGAQTGSYTLLSKFLKNCNFFSFEPFTETYNILNDNIKINNINNVKTYNIALSDNKGFTEFNICKSHNGLHTLGNNVKRFNDIDKRIVHTNTIDNIFFEKDIPIDFIKIDTEGYEYFILKGGINTIKKYKPIIQIEWNLINMEQCNITEEMLNNLINELGYKKKSIINEEIIICPEL